MFNQKIIIPLMLLITQLVYSQTPYPYQGFPKNIDHLRRPSQKASNPIAVDLNNDGKKEIIVASFDYLNITSPFALVHAINNEGSEITGFPIGCTQYIHDIAAGDVDNNGYIDIALRLDDSIDVIDYTGNHLPGFPVYYPTLIGSPNWVPANFINLYDLDGDGKLEIITGQYGAIAVFDYHGQMKPGWPRPVTGRVRANPAIGDIDGDEKAEIITGQFKEVSTGLDSSSMTIFKYNGDIFSPNWPIFFDSSYSVSRNSPSLLINSSHPESTYIFIAIAQTAARNRFLKYNTLGDIITIRYNPEIIGLTTFTLGDMNYDNEMELTNGVISDITLYHSNFDSFSGWPQIGGTDFKTPLIGKLSHNGSLYLLVSGYYLQDTSGFLYTYDIYGSNLPWSPLRPTGLTLGICINDINSDGSVELIANSTRWDTSFFINIWTVPGIDFNHNDFPWPMFGHDRYKSNQYGFIPPDEPIGIQPMSNEVPKEFSLYQNYPNPFNPSTTIKYTVKSSAKINLSIYDVLGRKVSETVNENQKPGTYSVSFVGSNLSSGVYYYRFVSDGIVIDTKKMILIK